MQIKVSHYPNNEVRVSVQNEPSLTRAKRVEEGETHESHPFLLPYGENCITDEHSGPLDITSDFAESSKPLKSGYGGLPRKTVFGLNAKRTIQRVGGVCDKLYPHDEFVFLTGTLPGSTPESLRAIAEWSGYIVHALKDWVGYYVEERVDFYVWEWQKRGALHLHYAVHVPDAERRELVLSRFKAQWIRLLESVCEKSGVDVFARATGGTWRHLTGAVKAVAQVVRKSVAGYLSKYCSKGHDTAQAFYYPSRWWGCSRALLHKLEEMTVSFEIVGLTMRRALAMYEELLSFNQSLTFKDYSYRHGSGIGRTNVGYHLSTVSLEEVRQCIVMKLSELSRGFSAVRNRIGGSQVKKQKICSWLSLVPSLLPLASEPLKQKLLELKALSLTVEQLSLSDWSELYSISCLNLHHTSLSTTFKRLKNESLREIRLSQLQSRYVRDEDGRYIDSVSVGQTW